MRQLNGRFDVDSWGLSANGVETDEAHAFNASWRSLLSSTLSHELRLQVVDNWSWLRGRHLFKAGAEYNRTGITQQFIGFANGRYVWEHEAGTAAVPSRPSTARK